MLAFKVPGMTCGGCVSSVRKALGAVSGVEGVEIDLATKDVRVEGSPDTAALRGALDDAGFEAEGLPAA